LIGPASPDRLRLQVLATSWRLHPPRACRPYSMPDPLLGSPFRAFFLPRSRTLFPASFPSWRSSAFRVSLHARVRHPVQRFRLKTERVALLGLFPSRVLPPSTLVRPSSDLPSCDYCADASGLAAPLQGFSRRKFGWSLSRLPTLLGFAAFWPSHPFEPSWILESPPKAPGVRHRPLVSPSSNPV